MLSPVVTVASPGAISARPRLALEGRNTVHLVWKDDGNLDSDGNPDFDIYYAIGGVGGFALPILVSDEAFNGASSNPSVQVGSDGCPHFVWIDDGVGREDVYYRRSARGAGGLCVMDPSLRLTELPEFTRAFRPSIGVDGNDPWSSAFVVFQARGDALGSGADLDTYFVAIDAGQAGALLLLSEQSDLNDTNPGTSIVVETSSVVHVVFTDGPGVDAIDAQLRTWNRVTGLEPLIRVSDTPGSSSRDANGPRMALRGTTKMITWWDNGNLDGDNSNTADYDVIFRAID